MPESTDTTDVAVPTAEQATLKLNELSHGKGIKLAVDRYGYFVDEKRGGAIRCFTHLSTVISGCQVFLAIFTDTAFALTGSTVRVKHYDSYGLEFHTSTKSAGWFDGKMDRAKINAEDDDSACPSIKVLSAMPVAELPPKAESLASVTPVVKDDQPAI
jgi:hypothetical protein